MDCMPQLFFRPKYVCFPVHLKGPVIPDPSGQLVEQIVYITSTRLDLYSHQSSIKSDDISVSMCVPFVDRREHACPIEIEFLGVYVCILFPGVL